MYYQILIETKEKIGKSKTNKVVANIDETDKDEIIKDVLIPYQNSEEFIVNGYVLRKEEINRLKIVTTEKSARELSEYENDNMPTGLIMYISPEDILHYDKYTTDITKQLMAEAKEIKENVEVIERKKKVVIDKAKVFIVHGQDNELKLEIARFIERMGFEPIILHEQASNGMTIIEKIEQYSNVSFGIILYTPCDIGYQKNNEDKKLYRARQNVVFEHGYLIAKLGRNNVCALVKQEVETPNDISGVVYIPFDKNGGWQIPLAKEMKGSGYNIDFNLIM
ncbi:TIR domain-containing protein [Corticicoccus populi]|uniref:TIR domain-containing protein n=1 Tax=Corticicoccus populi TaxID=1812821 RepID=A0ABW5WYN2_9STAP